MHFSRISPALSLTRDDSVFFLNEIAAHGALSNFDIELWASVLRINGGHDGFRPEIEHAALRGISRHPELKACWDEVTAPPKVDWRKEEEERQRQEDLERAERFRKHREEFSALRAEIVSGNVNGPLHNLANAYLDRYLDLDHEVSAVARLQEWLGEDLAEAALSGFVAALHRADLPTARMIGEMHAEDKTYDAEAVLICGIAELGRKRQPLTAVAREVLKAALAAWWECPDFNAQKLGGDLGHQLEAAVFTSDDEILKFLTEVMEPRIREGHERVSELYQLSHDERYRGIAGGLALSWLRAYPDAKPTVQRELIDTAVRFAPHIEIRSFARERAASVLPEHAEFRPFWMGALFLLDFEFSETVLIAFYSEDPANLWALRRSISVERGEKPWPLSVRQCEFIIETFAEKWRAASYPAGSCWGDQHAWNATEFILSAITSLSGDRSKDASDALARLVANQRSSAYRDEIRHARAAQQRLRLDSDYQLPTFSETKAMLAGGLPETIDDLKAFLHDVLDTVQIYLRQGDTTAWKAFWSASKPCDENTCRDRLLDILRGYLPRAIAANPETRMPDAKRADVGVIYNGLGLPIEIKGQWHADVWNAPSSQLIDLYTKDYRANGRGIYLVLWFGPVSGKEMLRHPIVKSRPGAMPEFG
jgi:hypothetical protein